MGKSNRPKKIHLVDDNPSGIYCYRTAIINPVTTTDKEKVNCGNCAHKMKRPRVSMKRLTKIYIPIDLPNPTNAEVIAAEERGREIEEEIHKTNITQGWW